MSCYACASRDVGSVHDNVIASNQINYVAHSGTGVQIVKCRQCDFMSVQFIHPKTISLLYQGNSTASASIDSTQRSELHLNNCQNQLDSWKDQLPENCNRVLFFGAGRAEHASLYLNLSEEVFACDLSAQNLETARENSRLNIVDLDNLRAPHLENTFEMIVFSNVLERLTFPQSQLSLCARLLKADGVLALEVPDMSHEDVRGRLYGSEEINYFSLNSLHALISTEGNFEVASRNESEEPALLKDATGFLVNDEEAPPSKNRPVIRMTLRNIRNHVDTPQPNLTSQDMADHLLTLSYTCLIQRLAHRVNPGQDGGGLDDH